MSRFFIWLSGANPRILRQAPADRPKYTGIGGAILTTATMAAFSAALALHMAVGIPVFFSVVIGAAWGIAILNLDRWLVVSMQRQDHWWKSLGVAVPRVLLAIVIGLVISTPLVLRIFQPEIENELNVMARERAEAFDVQIDADQRFAEIPMLEARIRELQNTVDAGLGSEAVLADPEVQRLQGSVDSLEAAYQEAERNVVCEKEGTCGSGRVGAGIAFREKVAIRDRLLAERDAARAQLNARMEAVRVELAAEEDARRSSAQAGLDQLTLRLDGLRATRQGEIGQFEESNENDRGLLARIEALYRLSDKRPSLATAHLLLLAFITAIDSLPVLVKSIMSLGKPNVYERVLALEEDEVTADRELRVKLQRQASVMLSGLIVEDAQMRQDVARKVTQEIAAAQTSLASRIVTKWRARQEQRIDDDLDQFLDTSGI